MGEELKVYRIVRSSDNYQWYGWAESPSDAIKRFCRGYLLVPVDGELQLETENVMECTLKSSWDDENHPYRAEVAEEVGLFEGDYFEENETEQKRSELSHAADELQASTVGCGSEEVFTENMKKARSIQAEINGLDSKDEE